MCIVALGETLVIITRQIDLSVGAMVAASAFVAADWLEAHPDGTIAIVFVIGIGAGVVMGIGNALLVVAARVPAIVATLGYSGDLPWRGHHDRGWSTDLGHRVA